MYVFIVLFFVSLAGIIFMVGRKLRLLSSGQVPLEHAPFSVPRLDDLQKIAGKIMRRLGYFLLVEIIRAYVRLVQFFKNKYNEIKIKLAKRRGKPGVPASVSKEPSRFLKTMAEYKRKIGKIKKEIKEEENL
jgi:hypothetical protein